MNTVEEGQHALKDFGFDDRRCNELSSLVLLALLSLSPADTWDKAMNPMLGTRAIMDWIRDEYGKNYAANSRETIRRFTLHQFVIGGIVEENFDKPDRPMNSPNWNYRITEDALTVFQLYGDPERFHVALRSFQKAHKPYLSLVQERMNLPKTPVTLPSGKHLELSPGGQSELIKPMVEDMLPRFAPGCIVAYIDDTDHKHGSIDSRLLDELGITMQAREKAPDVIAWDSKRGWLFLMEAASTHGPIDVTRKVELEKLFHKQWDKVVLVSCFPDRKTMRQYLPDLAWETEAWCADTPDHLMHFDGSRFMGPYSQME